MSRKLLAFMLATVPPTAHVACASSNGDAPPPEVRDAGSLEASRTGRVDPDDDGDDGDTEKRDGSRTDVDEDAAADADTEGDGIVQINEIYVDIDGLGDGAEFVELSAEPGTPVDDLLLRILDGTGAIKYTVLVADPGEKVGASGFWVVGGNQTFKLGVTDRVDQTIPLSGWGLPTSRGAVQLVRGTSIVDVVSWSTDPAAEPIPPPPSLPAETGEGSPARVPTITKTAGSPAHSFGRRDGIPDSDDNRADFCSMAASPGVGQKGCD
jgi:hypothetical protein